MAIANPEVEFHMNGFLDQRVEPLNNHYDSKFPNLPRPEVKVKAGCTSRYGIKVRPKTPPRGCNLSAITTPCKPKRNYRQSPSYVYC